MTPTAAPPSSAAVVSTATSNAVVTASPRPTDRLAGLWAGDLASASGEQGYAPPWLAMRVRPGRDPDQDYWRLESGPWPSVLPPATRCTPQRVSNGWELSACRGMDYWDLSALVPDDPATGIEVTLRSERSVAAGRLERIEPSEGPASTENVTVLWHQPGRGIHTDIWADAGLVFAPRFDGRIEIIDAEDGRIISRTSASAPVFDVKSRDGYLYAATVALGLLIFDVSDPETPVLVSQFEPAATDSTAREHSSFHNIFLSPDGKFVYAINDTEFPGSDLLVIDVSDPTTPIEAGRFRIPTDTNSDYNYHVVHDVNVIDVDGRLIAFLNYLSAGLWVLDVTDPTDISALGTATWDRMFSHSGWPFELDGRLYYAHTSEGHDRHLTVLDVTEPSTPTVVSRYASREGISIHNVQVVEGVAYVSYYIDGLRVVDLREPETPREIAHYDTVTNANERGIAQGAWGIRVTDGVVYISDMEAGIYAFRVDIE